VLVIKGPLGLQGLKDLQDLWDLQDLQETEVTSVVRDNQALVDSQGLLDPQVHLVQVVLQDHLDLSGQLGHLDL
jgi:hypothetical protein